MTYFNEGAKLRDGQTYIGTLVLKKVNNKYLSPVEPIIILATPVYKAGRFEGVVVLHYYANYSIKRFEDIARWRAGEISLITHDGDWIFDSANADLGFKYITDPQSANAYKDVFPDAWRHIITSESQFSTNEGVFTVLEMDLAGYLKSRMRETADYEKYIQETKNFMIVSRIENASEAGYYTSPELYRVLNNVIRENLIYQLLIILISFIVTFLKDMNRRSKLKVKFFATHDGMTYLWNRRAGMELLEKKLPEYNKRKGSVGLCYIDVNGLKTVNDSLGHKHGDELLLAVADCLQKTIRETDMAVRMGGDEFLLILNDAGRAEVEIVCKHVQEKIDQLNETFTRPYIISLSYGIISSEEFDTCTVEEIITESDRRMYEQKMQVKKGLQVLR